MEGTYTLTNEVEIPKLGLGTWFINDTDVVQAVEEAAKIGYRHIETAQVYRNECGVGDGIRTCGVKRENMFVSTKLPVSIRYDLQLGLLPLPKTSNPEHMKNNADVDFVISDCTSAPMSTSSPTAVPSTPIVTVSAVINPPPTVALSATATNPLPIAVPSTEEVEADANQDHSDVMEANRMNIQIGDHVLTGTLVENSSVEALKEALFQDPIAINMRDYDSMEKVGSLGMGIEG